MPKVLCSFKSSNFSEYTLSVKISLAKISLLLTDESFIQRLKFVT